MKKLIFISGFIFISLFAVTVSAQYAVRRAVSNETVNTENIDNVQFVVQYQVKIISDTLNKEDVIDELMVLKAGSKSSVFYNYNQFVADSMFNEQRKKSERTGVSATGFSFVGVGMITPKVYKNYPAGKVTTLDKVTINNNFRCEEENEVPAWQLLTDTMTILSYTCQKAVCHFKGRDYEAWFTPEIPRSEGPWKLHGLPGLILKAADSQGHYTFECTGMVNTNEELLFGGDGYETISRKNLNKIYERFATDPTGYISSSIPNAIITVNEREDGKAVKNLPYNPIECDE